MPTIRPDLRTGFTKVYTSTMTTRTSTAVVWHRGDLRTHDHLALLTAVAGGACIGVVILDTNILDATSPRRRAFFYANVRALRETYRARGGELYVRTGLPWDVLPAFIRDIEAQCFITAVHALRTWSPYGHARDTQTEAALHVPLRWHDGLYVRSPGSLHTQAGTPFSVYAPYLKAWRGGPPPEPLDAPHDITSPALDGIDAGEIPTEECDVILPVAGEATALQALTAFLDTRLHDYADTRDRLDGTGSSRLSIPITVGALSARTAAAAAWERGGTGASKWTAEIAWRDFLADMIHHRPQLLHEPFHDRWKHFAWNDSDDDFVAWRDGATGVPVVDAAMRELRATGWISNRARMVAAQFLTKHLRVHWTKGARVFHAWLLDGDVASNTGNWQWSAGLGIDNAPYFRVFNPVTQGKTHDPDGDWLRKWVPESGGSPATLPHAIVDLAQARREYLGEAEARS